jgi:glucose-1-phosphate thymidylyltransferase
MIGVILAGGTGSRLWPLTRVVSKQLLPIHDKPMIYYPLTTLMLSGIREVVVISTPHQLPLFEELLSDGSSLGMKFHYSVQMEPNGIPTALSLVPKNLQDQDVALILGDNLLYGVGLGSSLMNIYSGKGALAFAHKVSDPTSYGVVEIDREGGVISIEEKPQTPKSFLAIPGLYFFDKTVYNRIAKLKISKRGEYEITDLLRAYLSDKELNIKVLERGTTWLDTGTPDDLIAASEFIRVIEARQGLRVGIPEEVAFRQGFIDLEQLRKAIINIPVSKYRDYLLKIEAEESGN